MQVRERGNAVGKIDGVIPQVYVLSKLAPVGNIFYEGLACRIAFDAFTAVEFDGAKHNLNIISRFGDFWCCTRKLVGKGRNGFIRKF